MSLSLLQKAKRKTYLPLFVGIAVIFPAVLVSSVLWHFLSAQITDDYEKRLQTNLKIFELVLENRQKAIHDSLSRLASDNAVRVTLELDIRSQLKRYLYSQFELSETNFLVVTSPDGEVLITLGEVPLNSSALSSYVRAGNTPSNKITEFDGNIYLLNLVPVLSDETILGFVCSGVVITGDGFVEYLQEKLDVVPIFWWNDRAVVTKAFPEKLNESFPENEMHDHEISGKKFKGSSKTITLGDQTLKIGVMISLEMLKERIGQAIGYMVFVLCSIVVIALFALHMFYMRRRAEDEKTKLEDQLQHSLKMEALGTLAGGIAHDFNNILSAILGYAELAKFEVPGSSSSHECIDEILKAGNRARDLVRQIFAFSRKSHKEFIPLSIYPLVNEAIKLLRASIPTTIQIKQDLSPRCGNILADPAQIHQVVMNICTNAAQAMEEKGGELMVNLTNEELSVDDLADEPDVKPGPYVKLSISDTGTGIEPQCLSLIFDPYFTTKDVGKGCGMGLAVVHGIVKSHKGMINVESERGKGTIFHVYFPQIAFEEKPEDEQQSII